MKGVRIMPRANIEPFVQDKTTIVTYKVLLDRMSIHVKKRDNNQTDFLTKAIINQLEREGDFEIRSIIEELEEIKNW